jgi:hypothetical protein
VYPVTADPRSSSGASQETVAAPLDAVAVTFRGALGAALIAAEDEAEDAEPVPAALVAVTLNVYAVPATRFVVTSHVVDGAEMVQLAPETAVPVSLYA